MKKTLTYPLLLWWFRHGPIDPDHGHTKDFRQDNIYRQCGSGEWRTRSRVRFHHHDLSFHFPDSWRWAYGATVAYTPSRVYYARTRDDELWRHRFNLDAWSQFTRRLRFTVGGSYLQSEDPADEQDNDFTVRQGRSKYYTYSANTGLDYQFGKKIGLALVSITAVQKTMTYISRQSILSTIAWFFLLVHPSVGRRVVGLFSERWIRCRRWNHAPDDFDRFYGSARIVHQFNRRISGNLQYAMNRVLYDGETEDEEFTIFPRVLIIRLNRICLWPFNLDTRSWSGLAWIMIRGCPAILLYQEPFNAGHWFERQQRLWLQLLRSSKPGLKLLCGRRDYRTTMSCHSDYPWMPMPITGILNIKTRFLNEMTIGSLPGAASPIRLLRWLYAGAGYSYSTVESTMMRMIMWIIGYISVWPPARPNPSGLKIRIRFLLKVCIQANRLYWFKKNQSTQLTS